MRRHPDRESPKALAAKGEKRVREPRTDKRGPKNRRRLWPTLNYTIEPGIGVVFHDV